MLVVLFGSTVSMGKWSRQYFVDNGFELIQKYNYVPDHFALSARFDKRKEVSKEEVLSCDFVYENNGMLVGFNKAQIIDAVRGRKQCLITVSPSTIDFIRQIKTAYGGYVTVIGTYIDDHALKNLFQMLPDITEEELVRRTEVGLQIKKYILEDRELFDYVVIYGGEKSVFNYAALGIQYDYILDKIQYQEKKLNDKMYVEMPYTGGENYIFVSYSHSDVQNVFPILHRLQLAGFRIWYDEGINGGENWRKILASKIQDTKCKNILLFASENSVQSRHVKAEINLALDLDKKITIVRFNNAQFGLDLEMYLSSYQYLCADDDKAFDEKIMNSLDQTTRINNKEKTIG